MSLLRPINWYHSRVDLIWPDGNFKNAYKKIRETRKLQSIRGQHFVERTNEGRKPDKNSSTRRLEFMPRNNDNKIRSRIPSLVFYFPNNLLHSCSHWFKRS